MDQGELLALSIDILERLKITYMVVGSFASGAYGEPRLTHDIDIVIAPSPSQIGLLCAAFPQNDFYVSVEAAQQALRQPSGQFNVIHPETGNKIDFMIARQDAWGREQIVRRQEIKLLPHRNAYAARPEDIIISKMIYYEEGGSEKHLRDITGMMKVSRAMIDRDYVVRWSDQLGLRTIWEAVLRRLAT